jgi:hypothetical protein
VDPKHTINATMERVTSKHAQRDLMTKMLVESIRCAQMIRGIQDTAWTVQDTWAFCFMPTCQVGWGYLNLSFGRLT